MKNLNDYIEQLIFTTRNSDFKIDQKTLRRLEIIFDHIAMLPSRTSHKELKIAEDDLPHFVRQVERCEFCTSFYFKEENQPHIENCERYIQLKRNLIKTDKYIYYNNCRYDKLSFKSYLAGIEFKRPNEYRQILLIIKHL